CHLSRRRPAVRHIVCEQPSRILRRVRGLAETAVQGSDGAGPGLPFALALMGILLAHELGHYFACRYHGIRSSYPYFIPAPSLIGTFVAFILMRSPIRSRRALFDVGASGPLVGFLVAIPFLIYGVMHSHVTAALNSADADVVFGLPLAVRLAERA